MGGLGSGRTNYTRTPTVEACYSLDVNTLTDVIDRPGTVTAMWWGDHDDPEGSIALRIDGDQDDERASAVGLSYTITDGHSGEERGHTYRVPLKYTDCNFGGKRPWFRCPSVVDGEHCHERVGKLYRPPREDLFLCRHCYNLGYTSSRTSGDVMKQAELRFRRVHEQIDGQRPHPSEYLVPPDRPTGMHRSTYEELVTDIEDAYRDWDEASSAKLRELASHYKDILED
jgi:hypothetical protein